MPEIGPAAAPAGAAALVVTDFPFARVDRERLVAALGAERLVAVREGAALRAALESRPDATVLCTFRPPAELHALAPGVRWVQLPSAGADGATAAGLVRPDAGVVVTTASGIHAVPIAEYAFGSMLLFARQWPRMLEMQRERAWPAHEAWLALRGRELHGATLGIVGLGNIGRQVARLGNAFGMRTLGLRRSAGGPLPGPLSRGERGAGTPEEGAGDPDVAGLYGPDGLRELLGASDFVVIAVPRTPATHHLIDAAALGAMRPGAYLVNVARGDVVDEAALIDALRAGRLGGAGLDVTEREPLDPDSPLWELPNVLISPHVSGATDRYSARFTDLFLDNLARWRAGRPLRNVVDPVRGY